MDFSIILAANTNSQYQKMVVNEIFSTLKKSKSIQLGFCFEKLIYESFQDINQFLDINLH